MKALLFVPAAAAAAWLLISPPKEEAPPAPVTENYLGTPLHPQDLRYLPVPGLQQRRVCTWSIPGGNRYRGSIDQALNSMGFRSAYYDELRTKMMLGFPDDKAVISRYGVFIRGTGVTHPPILRSMSFDTTTCFGTFVNFGEHVFEEASVYYVRRITSETTTLVVPHVCDNIGELMPPVAMPDQPKMWRDNKQIMAWIRRYGVVPNNPGGGRPEDKKPTNTVPEPGTLALLVPGLLFLLRRRV